MAGADGNEDAQAVEAGIERFVARFTPEIAALTRAARAALRARLPGAFELVYDNYNALAIGFASTPRTSDVAIGLAVYPRRVLLYFYYGAALPDPGNRLEGSGSQGRHVPLASLATLDEPAVAALIAAAVAHGRAPMPLEGGATIIKSVSAKQRPRRPKGAAA